MSTINNKPYSSPKNINLKGGILRFDVTQSSSPLDSTSNGLYINSSNQLVYSAQGSAVILTGVGGGTSVSSFDQLIANDQIMVNATGSPFIIDVSSGNINTLRLTSSVAGTGDLLQITNAGTGKDINGTSSTWYVSKAGAAVFASETISGTAGSTIFTITAGDVVMSDSSIAITDADNAATFSVTNNTATTASVFVLAGSGVFTGSTTTSFMTLTASGLTTGTVLYIPVAGLTTGIGINLIGTTALTTGVLLNVESGTTGTSLTGNGRLLRIAHTGTATSSGILTEITSAATDETVIFQVTASAALALGTALKLSTAAVTTGSLISALGAALTTGSVFSCTDLAGLTTGTGISLAHATSVIADGGSLIRLASTGVNTGGATNGTMLDIQTTAQVAGTQVLMKAGAVTTGVLLSLVTTTGMTSGSVIRATTSSAGACATNGFFSFNASGAFTCGASTVGAFHVAGAATLTGTILSVLGGALTTGIAVHITDPGTGMTSGSLLRLATATTGAVATNGVLSVRATGAYTSTSNAGLLDVQASATTAGTVAYLASTAAGQTASEVLRVVSSGYTTGYTGNVAYFSSSSTTGASSVVAIVAACTTAGKALNITAAGATTTTGVMTITANALTTGQALLVTSSGTITSAGEGLVNLVATGMTTGSALKIDLTEATLTTGKYINCYDDTGTASVFSVGENGVILFSDFTEVVTAANTITVDESGSVFFLSAAAEFESVLPAPVAGLHFTFVVTAAPAGASYTITTNASANIIKGAAYSSTGGDADSETAGCDTITFADGVAVAGDMVEIWCDGTNYFAVGHSNADAGITFTTAS